jgi:hypothetical protein
MRRYVIERDLPSIGKMNREHLIPLPDQNDFAM